MVIFLFILGEYILSCLPGIACVEVIGNPATIVAAGGFEFVTEFIGILVYRKKMNKE